MRKDIVTINRSLNIDSQPYKLFQKSKKLGVWNPSDIDFTQDLEDWKKMTEDEKELILMLVSQFQGGEEAVTSDLLPLIMTIADDGRIEEELFLTAFLFEEAKHTEFFNIFLNKIDHNKDLSTYHSTSFKKIIYKILPEHMEKLKFDKSNKALAEASTVYNMFAEGVIAETGFFIATQFIQKNGFLPGLMEGINLVKTDESRHIGYGTYLLQRLILEDQSIFDVIKNKMNELYPLALEILNERRYQSSSKLISPYELKNIIKFMNRRTDSRLEVLERAKNNI